MEHNRALPCPRGTPEGDPLTSGLEPFNCDDSNSQVFPGAAELCDGLDNDCDGVADDACSGCPASDPSCDFDGDGVPASLDCDDGDATVNPLLVEVCDGRDNNCDGVIDEGCLGCAPADPSRSDDDGDFFPANFDCDDLDPDTFPGAPELCDGDDNDCDGVTDEGCP